MFLCIFFMIKMRKLGKKNKKILYFYAKAVFAVYILNVCENKV